jgi:hypothetical protein
MTSQKQMRANRKDAVSPGILSEDVVLPGEKSGVVVSEMIFRS